MAMPTTSTIAAAAAMSLFLLPGAFTSAQAGPRDMSCGDLWYARNAIYARNGYCFKTDRAIATFGRGCFAPYGDLSGSEQRQVSELKRWESRKGCSG